MLTNRFPELAVGLGFHGQSWRAWRVLLAVVAGQGHRLDADQTAIARQCLGTDAPFPRAPAREVWIICGRRGGKSNVTAFIASMIALMPLQRTAEGELPLVAVIARNTKQARVVKSYMAAIIRRAAPRLIRGETQGGIALATGTEIQIMPALQASVRGPTFAAVVCDEIAHWWTKPEAAAQDVEVLRAVRPRPRDDRGAAVWCLSTPWMREGALWEAHERHYGCFEDGVVVAPGEISGRRPAGVAVAGRGKVLAEPRHLRSASAERRAICPSCCWRSGRKSGWILQQSNSVGSVGSVAAPKTGRLAGFAGVRFRGKLAPVQGKARSGSGESSLRFRGKLAPVQGESSLRFTGKARSGSGGSSLRFRGKARSGSGESSLRPGRRNFQ